MLTYHSQFIQAIHNLPLPADYTTALQKKIIHGVMEFYLQGSITGPANESNAVLATTFQKVIAHCVSLLIFLDEHDDRSTPSYLSIARAASPANSLVRSLSHASTPESPSLSRSSIQRRPDGSFSAPPTPSVSRQVRIPCSSPYVKARVNVYFSQLRFHELLQSVDINDDDKESRLSDHREDSAKPNNNEVLGFSADLQEPISSGSSIMACYLIEPLSLTVRSYRFNRYAIFCSR